MKEISDSKFQNLLRWILQILILQIKANLQKAMHLLCILLYKSIHQVFIYLFNEADMPRNHLTNQQKLTIKKEIERRRSSA